MMPIKEKQYFCCCIPKKEKPLKKRNYAKFVILDDFKSQKEQDIFDMYLLKLYQGK
jgi:hypothetical protein